MAPSTSTTRAKTLLGLKIFWWVCKFGIAALVIALPVRIFVAEPFFVTGGSMEPTLKPSEYLVLDKLSYYLHPPERGDVIIMRYPLNPADFYVKRVLGLPGEIVQIEKGKVTIFTKDGTTHVLEEPYLVEPKKDDPSSMTTLGTDEYFVMGDNRNQSSDSREWGPLESKFIIGRAFVRLYPFSKIQLLPGHYRFPWEK